VEETEEKTEKKKEAKSLLGSMELTHLLCCRHQRYFSIEGVNLPMAIVTQDYQVCRPLSS